MSCRTAKCRRWPIIPVSPVTAGLPSLSLQATKDCIGNCRGLQCLSARAGFSGSQFLQSSDWEKVWPSSLSSPWPHQRSAGQWPYHQWAGQKVTTLPSSTFRSSHDPGLPALDTIRVATAHILKKNNHILVANLWCCLLPRCLRCLPTRYLGCCTCTLGCHVCPLFTSLISKGLYYKTVWSLILFC